MEGNIFNMLEVKEICNYHSSTADYLPFFQVSCCIPVCRYWL